MREVMTPQAPQAGGVQGSDVAALQRRPVDVGVLAADEHEVGLGGEKAWGSQLLKTL